MTRRCNISDTNEADGEDAVRQRLPCGQDTPAGSSRSVSPRIRSAMASAPRPVVSNAHSPNTPNEGVPIPTISVANKISRCVLPTERFGQLLGDPLGARMGCYPQPQQLPARMLEDQKPVEPPKRHRWHDKHVHCDDAVRVIAEVGLPALRRRPSFRCHVLGHGGLADIDTELE